MIKSTQGSSARIVAAILCSLVVILLFFYIRQTNQYSTLLRLHHQSQTSIQEKTMEIARLKNDIKVKDSQCKAEMDTIDREAAECDAKSQTLESELEQAKQKVSSAEADKDSFNAQISAEKNRYTQMEQQLQKEAEKCAAAEKELEGKLQECVSKSVGTDGDDAKSSTNLGDNDLSKMSIKDISDTLGKGEKLSDDDTIALKPER